MAATSVPTASGQQQHGSHTTSNDQGNFGQRQDQNDVYIQIIDDGDVQPATGNIELQLPPTHLTSKCQTDEDHYDLPADNYHYDLPAECNRTPTDQSVKDNSRPAILNTGGTQTPVKDGSQNRGRAALPIPLAHNRPARRKPMSQPANVSSCANARHVLNPGGTQYEILDSAVDEAPYEGLNSPADVDSAAEYADVGGQAEAHDDISVYQGNSNQQLQLPQQAATTVLMERRRRITLGIVAAVLSLALIVTVTAAIITNVGKKEDQSDSWFTRSAVTSKPQCLDSMPLSVRYVSSITLPESLEGSVFESVSVFGDGTVLVGLRQHPTRPFLFKVVGSTIYSCFVTCEVYKMKLVALTPMGNLMCLGREGDMIVVNVKSSSLVADAYANTDFTRPCFSTRIRSTIIAKDAQDPQHASVSVQGVPVIYVTYLYKGIYQSTDEGATWRHIDLMSLGLGWNRFYYAFRISTNNHTDQLWIYGDDRHVQYLRLVTLNNGSLLSVRNLTRLLHLNPMVGNIAYNYPSHMLYSDPSKLIVHVIPVNRRQTLCQIQLTDSTERPISFPILSSISIYSLFVYKKPGTNNTTLYVALERGRMLEYALLGGN